MLLRDDRMTGYFVHPIYSILYVFGVNFTDIVMWFGIVMIVIGSAELIFSIVAMVSDVRMPEKRFRHTLVMVFVRMLYTISSYRLRALSELIIFGGIFFIY